MIRRSWKMQSLVSHKQYELKIETKVTKNLIIPNAQLPVVLTPSGLSVSFRRYTRSLLLNSLYFGTTQNPRHYTCWLMSSMLVALANMLRYVVFEFSSNFVWLAWYLRIWSSDSFNMKFVMFPYSSSMRFINCKLVGLWPKFENKFSLQLLIVEILLPS